MSRLARLALAAAFLAPLPAALGQAQLAWEQNVSTAYTDSPARAVVFGPAGECAIVGALRPTPASDHLATLHVRAADGSHLGSHGWPSSPVGSYGWIDAAIGAGGEIAVVGTMPGSGMLALCDGTGAFRWGPIPTPAPSFAVSAIAFDAGEELVVAGRTSTQDVWVARYSAAGTLLDSTTWAHPANGDDHAHAIAIDAQGNVLVVGLADHAGARRVYVLKLDAALDVVWQRERFGLQNLEPGPDLAVDASGNAYVACGTTAQGGGSSERFTLWKLSLAGETTWVAQASDATHTGGRATSVAFDRAGNLAVAGSWSGGNQVEGLVQSYDADGALRWSRPAGGTASFYVSVAVDPGGDVLAAGWSGSVRHALSSRHDRDGNPRWTHVDPSWEGQGATTIGIGVAPDGGGVVGCAATQPVSPRFLRWYRLDAAFFPVCEGDGSLGACPCGNESDPGERAGCAHSLGSGGRLDGEGYASLAADTLVLVGTTMPDTSVLYFQGDAAIAPAAFGDGLRCAGGSLMRLGVTTNVGGASSFPGAGDPPLSVAGSVGAASTRWYQAWFRDPTPHCTGDTFNASNALRVAWIP